MGLVGKIRDRLYRRWLATRSLNALAAQLRRRRGVLGLCYHALDGGVQDYPYRTAPEAFEAQLQFLGGIFEIVTLPQAVEMLEQGGLAARARPLAVVCFDDGYRCNWTQATPILERHGVPATLFAARDLIRGTGFTYLSEAELVALAAHPLWEVGGHGLTHNVLTGFLVEDQAHEIEQSAAWLTALLGTAPRGFAYPQGQAGLATVDAVRRSFDYAMMTDHRVTPAFDRYQIRRFCPMRMHDDLHLFAQALVTVPMEGA